MKITKIYLLVITILSSALLVFITPGTVSADRTYHFTFRVPVELNNIPKELTSWGISVRITDIHGTLIADSMKSFSVRGFFKGNIVLRFNAKPGANAASAKWYSVSLSVLDPKRKMRDRPERVMKLSGPWPYDQAKPVKTGTYGNFK